MNKIDLRAYEVKTQIEEPSFDEVASKALLDYKKIDDRFLKDDLEGVTDDMTILTMWVYVNEDGTYTAEIEDSDEYTDEDVNSAILFALDAMVTRGIKGRTRISPATIDAYAECGFLGSFRLFVDKE